MGSGGGGSAPPVKTPEEVAAEAEKTKNTDPTTRIGPTHVGTPYSSSGYLDSSGRDAQLDSLLNDDYKRKQEEKNKPPAGTLIG